jgi:NADH-quinone oxidoreductase subunit J
MVPLFSPEGLAGLIFLVIVAVTVTGAIVATGSSRLVRSVAGLALCFIGVAGIYYYLSSPFVAVMQMLIYVGAVCVVIAFAIMLADPHPAVRRSAGGNMLAGPLSLALGFVLFWGLVALAGRTVWPAAPAVRLNDGSMIRVGQALLTDFSMVFELISLVLLLAIIGALTLAREGRDPARRKP